MSEKILLNILVSLIAAAISIYLVKKLEYKPLQFREQRLKFFFGMFWLSVGLIYGMVAMTEILSLFERFFSASILAFTAISTAIIPVLALSSFLSIAVFGRTKKTYAFPAIMLGLSISYIYFLFAEGISGPEMSEFTTRWFVAGSNALILVQALGYISFAMCLMLFFIAFRTKQKLVVFKLLATASSISFFFLAGYLDLLGAKGIEVFIIRGAIALGAIIGYYAFFPTKWMENLVKRISAYQ